MPVRRIKYYTVKISPWLKGNNQALWYADKEGHEFKTHLAVIENGNGAIVPVFKCIAAPFYHVYPNHCTIVNEEIIEA